MTRSIFIWIRADDPDGRVFGLSSQPFSPTRVRERASKAWEAAQLKPITLHEARHTFASLMIAAGVNAKALRHLHGSREHLDHARSVRAPDARKRGRSRGAA